VHIPAWLPLSSLSLYPETQIGHWGKTLGKLHQAGIPLEAGFAIPVETFITIAEHNHLTTDKLKELTSSEAMTAFFANLKIPYSLAQELLKSFHQLIGENFSAIRTSSSISATGHQDVQENFVKGDTNTFDSILRLWGKSSWQQQQLFPGAIIITRQLVPVASGWSFSQDLYTHTKTQVSILATKGALLPKTDDQAFDHYKVDVRTWNILHTELVKKPFEYVVKPTELVKRSIKPADQSLASLSAAQAIKIAQTTVNIKRLFMYHCQIAWYTTPQGVLITDVDEDTSQPSTVQKGRTQTTLAMGSPVIPGVVDGIVLHGQPTGLPQTLTKKTVLVLRQLTPQVSSYLPYLAALIIEKPLPSFGKRLLVNFHMPTIANVVGASSKLQTGSLVVVDAQTGKIFEKQVSSSNTPVSGQTETKLFIAAGNPQHAGEYLIPSVDGVIMRSEFAWAQHGVHPAHLARSGDRDAFIQQLTQTVSTFKPRQTFPLLYKPLDLTSNDLQQLRYAGIYEQAEVNPYLGYRGAIRILTNFEVLDMELEALGKLGQTNHHSLGIIIPFTRTPSECRLIQTHIKRSTQQSLPQLELWWQVTTPENLLQASSYLNPELTGMIISIADIHALTYGIDPTSPDLLHRYPMNMSLMRTLIKNCVSASSHHKVLLHLEEEQPDLIELATELGLAGVIVKPYHADRTKRMLLQLEQQRIPLR